MTMATYETDFYQWTQQQAALLRQWEFNRVDLYFNTFIEIGEDCPVAAAEIPPLKGDNQSVANLQFEIIVEHPYRYTSDEVLFSIHALRSGISGGMEAAREEYFSKARPVCGHLRWPNAMAGAFTTMPKGKWLSILPALRNTNDFWRIMP